jgi:hypothetical protein
MVTRAEASCEESFMIIRNMNMRERHLSDTLVSVTWRRISCFIYHEIFQFRGQNPQHPSRFYRAFTDEK